jgi:hypothetical protein
MQEDVRTDRTLSENTADDKQPKARDSDRRQIPDRLHRRRHRKKPGAGDRTKTVVYGRAQNMTRRPLVYALKIITGRVLALVQDGTTDWMTVLGDPVVLSAVQELSDARIRDIVDAIRSEPSLALTLVRLLGSARKRSECEVDNSDIQHNIDWFTADADLERVERP